MHKYGNFSAKRWVDAMIEKATRLTSETESSYKKEASHEFTAMAMPIDSEFDSVLWAEKMLANVE